jgi:hypothetical protein
MEYLKKLTVLSIIVLIGLFPSLSLASEITIRPFLIDKTLTARETSTDTITIKNDYDYRKAVLYATVNEITLDNTGEIKEFISPVMTDRTNTVTSWIEITRGRIEVMPDESIEVPITVRVHPFAEPGEYQVFIGLVEAPNRPAAEAIAMKGDADGVIVKITIADERKDSMRISSFIIDRFITSDDHRSINIEVENNGDMASVPVGEVIFYDSRGIEINSVIVNENNSVVAPGEKVTFTSRVPLESDLGRFKANVSLHYGDKQLASLADTTFFYMMPIPLLVALFGGILVVALLVSLLFRRVFITHEEEDHVDAVTMYVREGDGAEPKDHDINLKNTK